MWSLRGRFLGADDLGPLCQIAWRCGRDLDAARLDKVRACFISGECGGKAYFVTHEVSAVTQGQVMVLMACNCQAVDVKTGLVGDARMRMDKRRHPLNANQ